MAFVHSPSQKSYQHLIADPHGRKKIRLVALDLDGTLLTSKKSITPFTRTRLRDAMGAGVKIVLATARPPRSVRDYFLALKLDMPTINYNGALIWDERRRRIVRHVPLEAAIARKVIAFARKKYPELLVSVEILDKWYTDHFDEVPEYVVETAKKFTPDFIGPLSAFLTVPITKLLLIGKPAWITDLETSVLKKFAGKISQVRSDLHLLQVMNPTVSKALALAEVAQQLGVDRSEVMAIGDAPNDMHMLQWAGLSLAPENAWDAVKQMVHAVLPSNDHDCVGVALERYVLSETPEASSQ
ncbi:MAG: Cof-type HAD-IIB family hydrolase [Phycisphaerales bacterium]|nr:Cof-type HAD-IIB family hydrolase [Phycisphaerales bacterium]